MLVTLQFPMADARIFSSEPNLRLPLPDWPEPATTICPQFVHHFGKACERAREPDEAWPDEVCYVLAKRGLLFDRLETRHAGFPKRRFRPQCAFRRLFCDGEAVVRVEIGIAHNDWRYTLEDLTLAEVLTIAREIAEIPTVVNTLDAETTSRPLIVQGRYLSTLYAHSTMNRSIAGYALGLRLVESADPLILVELGPSEATFDNVEGFEGLNVVDPSHVKGAKALFCRLNTKAGIVSTWILQKGTATADQLRSLRLCLSRLHAEREVLDLILKQIKRGNVLNPAREEAVNLLDQYFRDRIKIVNRGCWGGGDETIGNSYGFRRCPNSCSPRVAGTIGI